MKFHPAAQILTWCILVAATQWLALGALLACAALVLLCAMLAAGHKLLQLLRRTRWIMLSLLLIYAYSTAGQAVFPTLGMLSPTLEGLADGVLQLTRLLAALAGLAIVLERLHRQQLIAGLYVLLAPLRWIGLSRERLAVRLALTLHYAEVAMLREQHGWQAALCSLFEPHGEPARQMELPMQRWAVRDAALLGAALLMLWGGLR